MTECLLSWRVASVAFFLLALLATLLFCLVSARLLVECMLSLIFLAVMVYVPKLVIWKSLVRTTFCLQ